MTSGSSGPRALVPIVGIRWRPFRLPVRAPIATAAGVIEAREGIVVELRDPEDRLGFGEASPLPWDGDGGLDRVLRVLDEWAPRLLAGELAPAQPRSPAAAALRCALDCARLDLNGRRRGRGISTAI